MGTEDLDRKIEAKVARAVSRGIIGAVRPTPKGRRGTLGRAMTMIVVILGGLVVLGRLAPPGEPTSSPKLETSATAPAPTTRTVTLSVTAAGLKERRVPHNPDSPFWDSHELLLRTIKRSDPSLDWLPAEQLEVGCVPCFNALTAIAIVDGRAFALNGMTRTRASQMTVKVGSRFLEVLDPFAGPDEVSDSLRPAYARLLNQVWQTPGCSLGSSSRGAMQEIVDALNEGICLPAGD